MPEGAVETARPYLEVLGAIPLLARLPLGETPFDTTTTQIAGSHDASPGSAEEG